MFLFRKDDWTRGFAIVDFHQSDRCLLISRRHRKVIFLRQVSNGRCEGVARCGVRSSFEWYVLNINMFEKKDVGEAGKW